MNNSFTQSVRNAANLLVAFWLALVCLFFIPAVSWGQVAQILRGASGPNSQAADATGRSLAALDLAIAAAEAGLDDVSFEAVRRAVGSGPPVAAVSLGGLLGPGRGQTTVVSGSAQSTAAMNQQKIAQKLSSVNDLWKKEKIDPKQCYQVWKQLIFPTDRASEAFVYACSVQNTSYSYSLNLEEKEPERIQCGALMLLEWAKLAEETQDLEQIMETRGMMPGANSVVTLLRIAMAKDASESEVEGIFKKLAANPKALVDGPESHLLMNLTYDLLAAQPNDAPGRNELWEAISQQTSNAQRWPTNKWLKFAVMTETRKALERGDADRFRANADLAYTSLASLGSGNASYMASLTSSFYGSASAKAFEAGHFELGLDCLKRQTESGELSATSGKQLIDPNSKMFRQLLKLKPQQRYDALFDVVWTLPMLGLGQASLVAPHEQIPDRFVQNYLTFKKRRRLPLEQITTRDSFSISLLEWVIRDAKAIGKMDDVHQKIRDLEEAKSDDAPLAKLVLSKVMDGAPELDQVRTGTDVKPVLRKEVTTARGELLPLDMEIAAVALASPKTRQSGMDLAERLAGRGLSNRTNNVMHGRLLAGLGRTMQDNAPATAKTLKHFVKADDFRANNLTGGYPRQSLWLEERPGVWQHQACTYRSILLLKYPLEGQFEISFQAQDDTYGESAVSVNGLYLDFRGYLHDVAVDTIGLRHGSKWPAAKIEQGAKNSYVLRRDSSAGTLEILCDDESVVKLEADEAGFPFFGPQSMFHRKMALEDIAFDGDVSIPRKVDLLSPSLIGWSALFRSRRLPPLKVLSADKSDPEPAETPENSRNDLPYEWHLVDGVLESIDHDRLHAADVKDGFKGKKRWSPPNEEWLYYLRPLCENEKVQFEFYYEKGAYSVFPTIDRIAIRLDEDKIREHWITSNVGWYGISATNRLDAGCEFVLGKLELKDKSWNQAELRREGNSVILAVNGTDVYRQNVDEHLGGRFGLFHDRSKFQVRVRNIELTGDWPTKLPDDLFEKRG